jgi:hypothetical protein
MRILAPVETDGLTNGYAFSSTPARNTIRAVAKEQMDRFKAAGDARVAAARLIAEARTSGRTMQW